MKKIALVLGFICQCLFSMAQSNAAKVSIISWNIDADESDFANAIDLDIDNFNNDLKGYLTTIIESKFKTDNVVYATGMDNGSGSLKSYKSIKKRDKKIMAKNPSEHYMKVALYYTYPKNATISPNIIVSKLSLRVGFFDSSENLMWELMDRTSSSFITSDFGNETYFRPDLETFTKMYRELKISFQEKAF